jgi:hypothetical protein
VTLVSIWINAEEASLKMKGGRQSCQFSKPQLKMDLSALNNNNNNFSTIIFGGCIVN